MSEPPVRHFSFVRQLHLADYFTLANGYCGVAAIFEALKFVGSGDVRHVHAATVLVAAAFVLDVLDGLAARWRGTSSTLGRELDSLADVVSFGVAPAAIAFALGNNTPLDQIALIFFALCGLSRLARFNVTADALSMGRGKVSHFEGTPIPTSVIPLALALGAFHAGLRAPVSAAGVALHLPVLLFVLSGALMISKTLRIPKP